MSTSYVSCIKIRGVPILPPLMTPEVREECQLLKLKAIDREQKRQRSRQLRKYMEDLDLLTQKTINLTVQNSLESQLALSDEVPYKSDKMRNLCSETIDVSEYSEDGVRVLEEKTTPHKLIRSNSYVLDTPSPILLAHLEKEARKCVETDESLSVSPVTIIDSEEITDITVEQVTVTTNVDPQLKEILDKLPTDDAKNILDILTKQKENHKFIRDQLDDKSFSVSISSQSIYFSDTSPENLVNLRKFKRAQMDENQAACVIQAHARGYLTRRLLKTERVQKLIETIKDSLLCAIELHSADVIEEADVELHRRLIQQLSAACYGFHDVFFVLSIKEQMEIISLDRRRQSEKAKRPLSAASSISLRQSAKIK